MREAYQVTAQPPPGWRVADIRCTAGRPATSSGPAASRGPSGATAAPGGAGGAAVDASAGTASLRLAAGETLTCVFTVDPPQDPPGLTLRVIATESGGDQTGGNRSGGDQAGPAGTFGIRVHSPAQERELSVTVPGDGSAAVAAGADLSQLTPGTHRVSLSPPVGEGWVLAGAACGGTEISVDGWTVPVPVTSGAATSCVLRVARPAARLSLRMVTAGRAGAGAFVVMPAAGGGTAGGGTGWAARAAPTGNGLPSGGRDLPPALKAGTWSPPRATTAGAGGRWIAWVRGRPETGTRQWAAPPVARAPRW